jgi:pimeloyl-ACP methyl ester carboxylesterase
MFTYPCPTIFLPGIMGSALRDEYAVSPESVWSPFKLIVKAYDRITAHPSDLRYELKEPSRIAPEKVFEFIYGELIEELRHNLSPQSDQPVPVFPFAYDWRQPLESTEARLSGFIDEVIDRTKLLKHYHDDGYGKNSAPKVNLVAHSMGGLVVASYLKKFGETKVNKVATIATPFQGSLESISKVAIGSSTLTPAQSGSREREAARVTPALYYLLPSFKGAINAAPGVTKDIYLPDAWQPGILDSLASFIRQFGLDPKKPDKQAFELLKSLLDGAWKHRSRIEKLQLSDSKSWLCIVGLDEHTRVEMTINADSKGKPLFLLDDSSIKNEWMKPGAPLANHVLTGDNTVPYLGAKPKFIPTEQLVCVTPSDFGFTEFKDRFLENLGFHSALPNMNLVQRLVASHFKGGKYGKVWGRAAPDIRPGAQWDPPIPGLDQK